MLLNYIYMKMWWCLLYASRRCVCWKSMLEMSVCVFFFGWKLRKQKFRADEPVDGIPELWEHFIVSLHFSLINMSSLMNRQPTLVFMSCLSLLLMTIQSYSWVTQLTLAIHKVEHGVDQCWPLAFDFAFMLLMEFGPWGK